MKTITIALYSFDELEREARLNAQNEFYSINVEERWWEGVYETFIYHAGQIGIDVPREKITFQGFYSQGDGSAFSALVDMDKLLRLAISTWQYVEHPLWRLLPEIPASANTVHLIRTGKITVNAVIHQPYRAYAVSGEMSWESSEGEVIDIATEEELVSLEDWLDKVANIVNRHLYKQLEQEYEYLTSEEAVAGALRTGGYRFTADGRSAQRLIGLSKTHHTL